MPINVSSYLAPRVGGTYYLVEDAFVKGGYQALATVAIRDAIDPLNRKQGMLVYCSDTDKVYKLKADLTTWTEFASGTGTGTGTSVMPPIILGFVSDAVANDIINFGIIGKPNEAFSIDLYKDNVLVSKGTSTTLNSEGYWGITASVQTPGVYKHVINFPSRPQTIAITGTVWAGNSYTGAINDYFDTPARRIKGDLSNNTISSRMQFQSTVANGNSIVGAIPNGSATTAGFAAANSSNPDYATLGGIRSNSGSVQVFSMPVGNAPALPIHFNINYIDLLKLYANGTLQQVADVSTDVVHDITNTSTSSTARSMLTTTVMGMSGSLENSGFIKNRSGGYSILFNNGGDLRLSASSKYVCPADNSQSIGSPILPFAQVFAKTSAINTSDARLKTKVVPLTSAEIAAGLEIANDYGIYRFLEELSIKGAAARKHVGTTVQHAVGIMVKHGLDPLTYAFICYDEWGDATEYDNDGNSVERAAGNVWSFRPIELLLFCQRAQAQNSTELREKLLAFEQRLLKLEQK